MTSDERKLQMIGFALRSNSIRTLPISGEEMAKRILEYVDEALFDDEEYFDNMTDAEIAEDLELWITHYA